MIEGPFCKTEIIHTNKQNLINIIKDKSNKKVLLLASQQRLEEWNINIEICELIEQQNILYISRRFHNLNEQDIYACFVKVKEYEPDIIIAVGGGSTIDLAKALSALYDMTLSSKEDVLLSIVNKTYLKNKKYIDIIAIPTTAGTGSEVTQWATVWKQDKTGKLSIESPNIQPVKAYLIPELMITLPKRITLVTGLDALTHAVESYWARTSSPIVKDIAVRAIDIIMETLPELMTNSNSIYLRDKMCRGSLLSGIAFSKTRTTACHSISYAMTQLYNIEHGFAVAMTLDQVSQINRPYIKDAKELFSIFAKYGDLKTWLNTVTKDVQELSLKSFGIKKESINDLLDNCFTLDRMDNNPVMLDIEQVRNILENIYE